jgi:orotidine-5'-phosphate decarboxylase
MGADGRLILALDLPHVEAAQRLVAQLEGEVRFFKVGLAMQLAPGVNEFVASLMAGGKRVFLDYKYFDVPETVRKAVTRAAGMGVSFLTVHGPESSLEAAAAARGSSDLKLLAVTVLTSMDQKDVWDMGLRLEPVKLQELALLRARRAKEAGCDGVIASGQEARPIKEICGEDFLVVTPGIRPAGAAQDDQKRVSTPAGALQAGADYLVVGRPITEAANPKLAAEKILAEMRAVNLETLKP